MNKCVQCGTHITDYRDEDYVGCLGPYHRSCAATIRERRKEQKAEDEKAREDRYWRSKFSIDGS